MSFLNEFKMAKKKKNLIEEIRKQLLVEPYEDVYQNILLGKIIVMS
ncbi:MAG: hypothetical protein IPG12_15795 [Saprospiraceae bacterium]|nr:hypothetical protein [Saprospiraceae bacterium]